MSLTKVKYAHVRARWAKQSVICRTGCLPTLMITLTRMTLPTLDIALPVRQILGPDPWGIR